MTDKPLAGKVAAVFGATRGIGKGIAVELAAAGATVYATGRTVERDPSSKTIGSLNDTAADASALGGTVIAVRCDATSDDQVAAVFERIRSECGNLDILVNSVFNAPNFGPSIGKKFWELPVSFWHDIVDVGTRTAYVACVYGAPLLLAGAQRPGRLIVNVSGRGARIYKYNVAYGAGKAALDKITRDGADDLRDHGIAVVSIWPNVTRTESLAASSAAAIANGGPDPWADLGGVDNLESPRYTGRAVAALACDPDLLKRTGKTYWSAELGTDYGIVDEFGKAHLAPTVPAD